MNNQGKFIKKLADILAIVLIVMIFGGILGATGLLGDFIPSPDGESESEIISFDKEKIDELDIEVACADITFLEGESLCLEGEKGSFIIREKGDKITVEEKDSIFINTSKSRKLIFYVPEGFAFEKIQLETGASNVEGTLPETKELELDVGAGRVSFDSLKATKKAEIDCGAGEFTLKSGSLNNLDFSLGVGIADITTVLTGNSDIESGVGQLTLTLADSKDNYCFDVETGLGAIIFDGSAVKGETVIGSGVNRISLEGGVGSINVSFLSR